ncbi:uncharacterized protein VTP21DRAFT_1839 [Calcarisporiella thermophila]|uniref:uncharacterized protein n=1 Tax=Calcarisporiella thermophila TaxID=911321 RepID=UPI0037440C56
MDFDYAPAPRYTLDESDDEPDLISPSSPVNIPALPQKKFKTLIVDCSGMTTTDGEMIGEVKNEDQIYAELKSNGEELILCFKERGFVGEERRYEEDRWVVELLEKVEVQSIVVVDSLWQGYISDERAGDFLIRRLETSGWTKSLQVPQLLPPNFLSGLGATVLSYAEIRGHPACALVSISPQDETTTQLAAAASSLGIQTKFENRAKSSFNPKGHASSEAAGSLYI